MMLTIVFPALCMLQGSTTMFYIIYLYWWHELIASSLDGIYYKIRRSGKTEPDFGNPLGGRLFLLGIYFVFIVVFFGFMSNWGNDKFLKINILVLVFRDHIFTLNLLGILLNEWWLRHCNQLPQNDPQDPFSGRMLVMHISIIFGAVLHFFVIKKFPLLFTQENLWGSVVVALPFLLLKTYMIRRQQLLQPINRSTL